MARNTVNNSPESNENPEVEKKQQKTLLEQAQKQFVDDKLKEDINYFDTRGVTFSAFESYLNLQGGELSELSLKLSDHSNGAKRGIEKQILKYLVLKNAPRDKLLETVEKLFIVNYNLSDSQKNEIQSQIQKLKIEDLSNLQKKEKNRLDYLIKIKVFKDIESVELTETQDFFDNYSLTKSQIKSAQERGIDLDGVRDYFISQHVGDFSKNLLDFFSLINLDQKKQFLATFFQNAPFSLLEKIGLVSKNNLKDLIRKTSNKYSPNFSNSEIDDIVAKIDTQDYFIPIDFSGINDDDFKELIESEEFLEQLNENISHEKESLKNRSVITDKLELSKKSEYPDVLKKYVLGHDKINSTFSNLFNKAQNGDYLRTWNKKTSQYSYLKINNFNTGTQPESAGIEFEDKTHNGKFRPGKQGQKITMNYSDFIAYLEGISKVCNNDADISESEMFQVIDSQNIEEEVSGDDILPENNNIENISQFKEYLDEIDPENKGVPIEKTSFLIGKGDGKNTSFNVTFKQGKDKPVVLDNGDSFTYLDFLYSFEHLECKRFKTISSPDELLESIQSSGSEISQKYRDLKFKDGKIIKENGEGKKPTIFEYFISENKESNQSVYLDNAQKGDFYIGKYKKTSEAEKEKGGKDKFDDKFRVVNLTDLYQQIIQNGLVPYSPQQEVDKDSESKDDNFKQKGSFFKKIMKGSSLAELFGAFKIGFDAVVEGLERGSKLKSAKLAMKIARITGEKGDLFTSMQQIVEAENKKQMEEIVSQLKVRDSKMMIQKIIRIIENKDSEEYEKEAALMTIVGKYGTLYPKDTENDKGEKFCDRRSQLVWYRALGGKKNDELYLKEKAKAEQDEVAFTEERLVEALLKKQVKPPYNRRTKLHKDFGGALKGGMADERDDGAKKTGDMATLDGRVNYVVTAMKEGEVINGTGGLDNIIGKNGDKLKTFKAPFIYTITNLAQDVDQGVNASDYFGKGFGLPYTPFLFNEKQVNRDIYYNAINAIVRDIGDQGMIKAFEDIGKKSSNKGVEAASIFWDKYGDKLYDIIQCQDGYILGKIEEKIAANDPDYHKKLERQEIYKKYFGHMSGMINCSDYSFKDDYINDGRYDADNSNLAILGINKMVETNFELNTDGNIRPNSERLLSQSLLSLEKILQNPQLSIDEKKSNYMRIFRPLWAVAHKKYKGKKGNCSFLNTLEQYGMKVHSLQEGQEDVNIFNENSVEVKSDKNYNHVSDGDEKRLGVSYLDTTAYKEFCKQQTDKFFAERLDNEGNIIYNKNLNNSEEEVSGDTQNILDYYKNAANDKVENDQDRNPANDSEYHQQNVA